MDERPEVSLPLARECPFAAPAEYGSLREKAAMVRAELPGGRPAWLVTRLEEARAALADPHFTGDRSHPAFPLPQERPSPPPPPPNEATRRARARGASLIGMDPPEHTAARRAVIGEFTARRIRGLRPRIQQIVDMRIDAILAAGPPADLVPALALPVPSEVICELLGVPYDQHEFFQSRSMRLLSHRAAPAERRQALLDLFGFLDTLVTAKENDPGDDLLGRQITQHRAAGGYDHDHDHRDLVSLAFLLLLAGHETTANMISLGVLAILRDPGRLLPAVADPDRRTPAVDELLRYFSIADLGTGRVALAGTQIGGTTVRSGEGVLVSLLAANRDPAAFPEPGEIDPDRGSQRHVAFGYGPHQCLGQNLARAELEIVYETLFRRVPGLRLAIPAEEVPVKNDAMVYGLYELPVKW